MKTLKLNLIKELVLLWVKTVLENHPYWKPLALLYSNNTQVKNR